MPNANRIFTDAELEEFQKDCMDLALEAIDRGDLEKAKYWCRKQTETKDLIHDLYLHWIPALLSHIYEKWGEDAAVIACRDTAKNFSIPFARKKAEVTKEGGLRPWIEIIIDLWRQHTMYPGFRIEEDDEKFILTMNPCGSGGRLINMGAYDDALGYKKLKKAGPHTWGEQEVRFTAATVPGFTRSSRFKSRVRAVSYGSMRRRSQANPAIRACITYTRTRKTFQRSTTSGSD